MLTIKKRPITIKALPATQVYGDAATKINYEVIGEMVNGNTFVGELSRQNLFVMDIGSYDMTLITLEVYANAMNYEITVVSNKYEISKRHIEIKADEKSIIYGENDPNLAYMIGINGMAFNEELTGNLVRQEGEEIGNYVIEQGSLSANDNYTITKFEKGNLTIEPALVEILLDNLTHIYDRNPKAVTAITRPTGLPVKITYNGSTEPPVSIGRYTVIAVIDDRNYSGEVIEEMVISSPDLENNLKATKVLSKSSGESMTFRMEFEELVRENKIVFFDAKGKVVFEQTNYRSGDYDMSTLPEGTYFYVFSFTKNDGSRHVQKKFVEIIP